ncbi:hypothetical protein TARUN_1552 [Trichoderma arundinaceum]|uniref:Uncharacterized protein n=1 Tax=Trichoderma arundinaceum TaxID=490622 RepID=A0A395NXZ6_TRIAR|nr:hypothetical protein TARUN_1552 [Trichoderma arundinaceum]
MASTKRTVIELSSDSDDDNPLVTRRRKIRRRSTKQQPHRDETESTATGDRASFEEFLARALPTKLIATDVAEYIQRESNIRLKTARQEGVTLDNVFIGRDCLPTWIGMSWDPEKETLHCAIQDRLLDFEVSGILGDVLRKELMDKGNRRLEEARQLGIDIADIIIGKGLLATWNTPGTDLEAPPEGHDEVEELEYDYMAQSSLGTAIPYSSLFSRGGTPESEISSRSTATLMPNSPDVTYESSDSSSNFGDSRSGSDFDGSTDDEELWDDIIRMNNAVDPQPHYSESDDEAPHILHDAEIAGGPEGYSDVDLEIYLAEDDEDIEDLPELELAIDGEAFACYFGDHGAVDVEIPGINLSCSLDIPQYQSDEDSFTGYSQIFEEEEDGYGLNEDEDEQSDMMDEEYVQDEDATIAQIYGFGTRLEVPMLQSEDEELNAGIHMTEDGFMW